MGGGKREREESKMDKVNQQPSFKPSLSKNFGAQTLPFSSQIMLYVSPV